MISIFKGLTGIAITVIGLGGGLTAWGHAKNNKDVYGYYFPSDVVIANHRRKSTSLLDRLNAMLEGKKLTLEEKASKAVVAFMENDKVKRTYKTAILEQITFLEVRASRDAARAEAKRRAKRKAVKIAEAKARTAFETQANNAYLRVLNAIGEL